MHRRVEQHGRRTANGSEAGDLEWKFKPIAGGTLASAARRTAWRIRLLSLSMQFFAERLEAYPTSKPLVKLPPAYDDRNRLFPRLFP